MKDTHVGLAGSSAVSGLTEAVKMNSDPEQKAVVRAAHRADADLSEWRSALRSAHGVSE